jgi:hypothetical protein
MGPTQGNERGHGLEIKEKDRKKNLGKQRRERVVESVSRKTKVHTVK